MRSSRIIVCLSVLTCSILFASCWKEPLTSIQISERNVETVSFEETIRMDNCGNPASSEQIKEHTFSTSVEGVEELRVNYQIVEGSISSRYAQYRSDTTSQRLTASPNTNMEFVLRWLEEVRAGNVVVDGRAGSYTVRIPIGVDQISGKDLGCPVGGAPAVVPTTQIAQSVPTSVAASPNLLCPMIVIEGSVGGLPIVQTKTWSELTAQGTTREPQSTNLGETCSRDSDNEVQVWVGYWSIDPSYLHFYGSMTPDAAVSLVRQHPDHPVIIVPWGE